MKPLTVVITMVSILQIKSLKLLEWVLNFSIHKMVNIDEMQFAFVPGRDTIDDIFIARQLQ